jgi:isopentenyldiphosphate isomerase
VQDLCQIVDSEDVLIGAKPRAEIDPQADYYRISGIWLTNSKGQVLIAQRSFSKDKDPGKWTAAVNGTLEIGETYETNAYKEAAEELGLKNISLKLAPKAKLEQPYKLFCQWFTAVCDMPEEEFVLQTSEVIQVKWIGAKDLIHDARVNPDKYVGTLLDTVELLYK